MARTTNSHLDLKFNGVLQAEPLTLGNSDEQPLIADPLILGVHFLGQAAGMKIRAIARLKIDYRLGIFLLYPLAVPATMHWG